MADPVSLGLTIALTAANMALTAAQVHEGPRLTDLKATVADYGTPCNYAYGTRRVQCPAFYAEPIEERKKKRKGKGGKQVSYTGFGTFAVHLADHPIAALRRLYFDQHLVYVNDGSGAEVFPLAEDYELASFMRIYDGTQTDPDPRMLAAVEAAKGPGTCPAYLDTSWVMFEDVPFEQIGNRYPQVRAEIETGGEGICAIQFQYVPDFPEDLPERPDPDLGGSNYAVSLKIRNVFTPGGLASFDDYFAPGGTEDELWSEGEVGGIYARRDAATKVTDFFVTVPFDTQATLGNTYFDVSPDEPIPSVASGTLRWRKVRLASLESRTVEPVPAGDWTELPAVYIPFATRLKASFGAADFDFAMEEDGLCGPGGGVPTLGSICADIAERSGLTPDEYDFSPLDQEVRGYSWTQGNGRQILEPLLALHASTFRPHDFLLEGIKRGATPPVEVIADGDFAAGNAPGQHYSLRFSADSDLPQRVALTFADTDSEQQPNTAVMQRSAAAMSSTRDQVLDFTTVALTPAEARDLLGRYHRRLWFARGSAEFGLTRRAMGIEAGDVRAFTFEGEPLTLFADRITLGANGLLQGAWSQDDPALAALPGLAGAPAAGHVPSEIYSPAGTTGEVLDLPLLTDAHDQAAPLAYLVAAPDSDDGAWPGADVATSDDGIADTFVEGWGSIGTAAVFGTVADALPDVAPFVFDGGSAIEVTIESGTLQGATLDDVLNDGTRNLALVGGELVQFTTATLTAPLTYTLAGFLRGVRGTEHAIAGHAPAERFVLLDGAAAARTLGAGEIGDTDHYAFSTLGRAPDPDAAQALPFTGASHRPYAPVNGVLALDGADWTINATRRTRVGGATLNGQDVPLGEASEAWEAHVMDGATVKRTLSGTALPLTYLEADQIADWGVAQAALTVRLFQVNPTLTLRGYPLEIVT